jgi:hypothetical protein
LQLFLYALYCYIYTWSYSSHLNYFPNYASLLWHNNPQLIWEHKFCSTDLNPPMLHTFVTVAVVQFFPNVVIKHRPSTVSLAFSAQFTAIEAWLLIKLCVPLIGFFAIATNCLLHYPFDAYYKKSWRNVLWPLIRTLFSRPSVVSTKELTNRRSGEN